MPQTDGQEPEREPERGREELVRGRTDSAALSRLLDEWMQGDAAEQRDTFEFLRQALDEDRPAGYKLFP